MGINVGGEVYELHIINIEKTYIGLKIKVNKNKIATKFTNEIICIYKSK
jgi:hypothetical protein